MNGVIGGMLQSGAGSTYGNSLGMMNATQPQAPKSPMQAHAETVHELASRLQELNGRLCQAIDRIAGGPLEPAVTAKDQPPPSGALVVAQFGAERINQSIGRLTDLVQRLEGIV